MNVISLAFVGDAYYACFVRARLAATSDHKANMLNRKANTFVCAKGQAYAFDCLAESFSENELDIARRARNQHTNSQAKNADPVDYKKATALEAVVGFLVLSGQLERAEFLMDCAIEAVLNKKNSK